MSVGKLDMGTRPDPLRVLAERLPRPLRFLGVGTIGLTTDICVFTLLMGFAPRPLVMRLFSIAAATLVALRLNRALTFDASGRTQHDGAMRYALVTAGSPGTSYSVFAALVLTVFGWLPQAALLVGCAA